MIGFFSLTRITFNMGFLLGTSIMTISQYHQPTPQYLSEQEVAIYARSVTVRIFSEEDPYVGASGILIRQQGQKYTVVTNHHVIKKRDRSYHIQTPDGNYYSTNILASNSDDDLGFLTFYSPEQTYETVAVKQSFHTSAEVPVISGGFPYRDDFAQSQEFRFSTGNIAQVLDRSFIGGYQIGYTNFVAMGMSGGPILNYYGELIGINGMGKYPLFGNPYVFKDGSTVSNEEWDRMSELSWGIPGEQILTILNKI